MATPRRRAYVAKNPAAVAAQQIDQTWDNASNAAWTGVESAIDLAGYTVQHPVQQLEAMGDFGLDAARIAWDTAQDAYGVGYVLYNQITRVISTPCADKWDVLIETALPAAGNALWLLLVPSPDEILENYLQPYPTKKGRRGGRDDEKKRRRRSRSGKIRRAAALIPDVDDLIANSLPGRQAVAGRNVGFGQRWLFTGIQVTDRVLWWWLVADVLDTFATEWTSGLREARFCSEAWQAVLLAERGYCDVNIDTWDCGPLTVDTQANVEFTQIGWQIKNTDGFRVNATSGEATVQTTWQIPADDPDDREVRLRAVVYDKNQEILEVRRGPVRKLTPGDPVTQALHFDLAGVHSIDWGTEFISGFAEVDTPSKQTDVFAKVG